MMLSSWRLLFCFCCLLLIVHLSCATVDPDHDDNDNDNDNDQSSHDDADRLSRRRARRRHRLPTRVVADLSTPGVVDRLTLTSRRDRSQSRRRKKPNEAQRRGRGGAGRGWRRRVSFPETSTSVFTTVVTTDVDELTSATSPSVKPVTSLAAHPVTPSSGVTEITRVAEVTDDSTGSDVVTETASDDSDDMMMIMMPNNLTITSYADVNQRAVNACRTMQCPRHKVCLLNIQGLPMCRCPSVYHCRGLERRPVCTVDGHTYRNKCFLRVEECAANRRQRVLHRGACRAAGRKSSLDAENAGVAQPHRRGHRIRQRQLDQYSLSAAGRGRTSELHRRRGRTRRRRPRHQPIIR